MTEIVRSRSRLAIKLAVLLILASAIGVLYLTPARQYVTFENARRVVGALRSLWYGPLVYIGLYAMGTVLALPATIFILSAGVIWGWWPGALYAMAGGLIGAMASLILGRFLGKGLLPKLGRAGAALEKRLESATFSTILLIRLIPVVPFPVMNYAAGIAGVGALAFFLATAISLAPGTFIVSYSADAIANGTLSARAAFARILVAAFLLMLLVLLPAALKKWLGRKGAELG